MGDRTSIEWTRSDDGTPGATWNPTTGCSRVSPGCDHCYAERMAARLAHTDGYAGVVESTPDGPRWTGKVNLLADKLDVPLRWKRPRRIFVNSMSDLFHEGVPDEFIAEVAARMSLANRHVFQVLTKRPQRMARLLSSDRFRDLWFRAGSRLAASLSPSVARGLDFGVQWPIPNAWWGTSVESQPFAFRCRHILGDWNAVPWVSAEPLLGLLELWEYLLPGGDAHRLAWVVVGGESGPGSRPMHPEWARSLRDQCASAGVPFLFKQAGSALAKEWGMSDHKGGTLDELPEDLRIREYPRGH